MLEKGRPSVVFFNHNELALSLKESHLQSTAADWEVTVLKMLRAGQCDKTNVEDLNKASVAIEHGCCLSGNHGQANPEYQNASITQWAVSQPVRLVVVKLSSQSQSEQPVAKLNGPVLLWAQDAKRDGLAITSAFNEDKVKGTWAILIPKLLCYAHVCSWVEGKVEDAQLDKFFRPKFTLEYFTSVSILCQGFLAQFALNPKNVVDGGIDTKGCADVDTALRAMGWVNEDGSKPEIVRELECERSEEFVEQNESGHNKGSDDPKSNSDSELGFWQSPFEGKSLRQGLEKECRSLRKNVQNEIQNGTLEWPDSATLPSRTAILVEAIETAIKTKETLAEAKNNKLFDEDFICVVAKAYLELNILLEAV